jgi:hypothetical protein
VEPLSVITDVSNCPYGHKMSNYTLLKTDKVWWLKQTKLGVFLEVKKSKSVPLQV